MTPEHERRVASIARVAEAVRVTQRGYTPPEPEAEPEVVRTLTALRVSVEQANAAREAEAKALAEQSEAVARETVAALAELKQQLQDGTNEIVDTLARPVRPVFDGNGKLIAARRTMKGEE